MTNMSVVCKLLQMSEGAKAWSVAKNSFSFLVTRLDMKKVKIKLLKLLGNFYRRLGSAASFATHASECQAFGPYMNNRNITLRVVTSESFLLEKESLLTEGKSGQEAVARYIELHKVLHDFQDKQVSVKCYVALQSILVMQARFIVIDQQVYILGSSLHKFGAWPTVLYRLPAASAMIRTAREWLRQESGLALPFEDWLAGQIADQ